MQSSEQLYEQCCEAARCLLAAFETRDRGLIEHQVGAIREYLRDRDTIAGVGSVGQDLLRHEQLDALDAIVSHLESCLRTVRETEQCHFERMLRTQSLLKHLARRWDSIPLALLPVC